eukprot:UN00682
MMNEYNKDDPLFWSTESVDKYDGGGNATTKARTKHSRRNFNETKPRIVYKSKKCDPCDNEYDIFDICLYLFMVVFTLLFIFS